MQYTVADVVRVRAAEDPQRLAVSSEDKALDWTELYRNARRVADGLQRSGIRPQERVSFIDRNCIEYFEFIFGCALLNVIPVPINWRLSAAEILETLRDAGSRLLIVGEEFHPTIASIEADLPAVEMIAIGDHGRWRGYLDWCGTGDPADPMVHPKPDDVAIHFYSSGTTGRPKGILWSAANAEFLLRDTSRYYGIVRDDVSLLTMPLFHSGGTGWSLCGMINGCKSVTVRQFEARSVLDTIAREGVTVSMFVPAMLAAICAVPGARDKTASVRQINYTGSPITEKNLLDSMAVFDAAFIQNYGLAETTGGFAQLDPEDHDPNGPRAALLRSVGKAYPGIELKVVDPETGEEQAPGAFGELWTRSGQNMLGYYNMPEATARTITADGWLKTGDGGYIDAEGYIFLTDRLKDVIISGGENVYPTEVENVLASHPAVAEVAVIGVPSERWGETVKAIVALKPGQQATAEELIGYSATLLAGYKRPTSVDFLPALPRNPTGKLLKAVLREPYWQAMQRRIA
ncbi:long-chain-fatty-acid--CoA ligase [Rhizorhabdus histidinilytica]|uniref:3-methylmercaptopropionyl-CoA ligase n=2 Tax=Rhizorhabdus histidinilytica TaxID=439228 RepID=A0A1T5GUD7_9SPHN|nr:long-chain-fatty-acid--CoA ligase [Rhizorhabdus histidinilytica]SKC12021.1 long-chain acyl-CoA synthetase [Rhizorhabdus histidinilytica]